MLKIVRINKHKKAKYRNLKMEKTNFKTVWKDLSNWVMTKLSTLKALYKTKANKTHQRIIWDHHKRILAKLLMINNKESNKCSKVSNR